MRHPADALIGIPWLPQGAGREGVSCWGLVVLYYRELMGIELPNFPHAPEASDAIAREIEAAIASGEWIRVEIPIDGDVVTLAHRLSPHHLGVWVQGRVLHVSAWIGQVVAETPQQLRQNRFGRVAYWRKKSL